MNTATTDNGSAGAPASAGPRRRRSVRATAFVAVTGLWTVLSAAAAFADGCGCG